MILAWGQFLFISGLEVFTSSYRLQRRRAVGDEAARGIGCSCLSLSEKNDILDPAYEPLASTLDIYFYPAYEPPLPLVRELDGCKIKQHVSDQCLNESLSF